MKILILGANGFIGSHLSEAILKNTDWEITAFDRVNHHLTACLSHPRFSFFQGDQLKDTAWVTEQIQQSDVILPLVAIATPSLYVENPLRVFELDFEANLSIVRQCVRYQKRLIFPSTSEVYGMCPDAEFDEETSPLVTGPIQKERWIYSASKQLMDRVIYAYGRQEGLSYTLFRPFNWYGPRLDHIDSPKPRVLTQFIGNILRGENISLVNGGEQRRAFTYVEDGIAALLKIIENKNGCANQKIFNIGNPTENVSIRELATQLIEFIKQYPAYAALAAKTTLVDVDPVQYYGAGYQDVTLRVPSIKRAKEALGWAPTVNLATGLQKTLDYYLKEKHE